MRDAIPVPLPFDRRQKPRHDLAAIQAQTQRVRAMRALLRQEMERLARMLKEAEGHD